MLANLASLVRYRGLIQSLVARELKARYRGSVLGFLWSFVNPLLLLLIYNFVFTKVMPRDYKRVLDARDRAAAQGIDADRAVMEAAHG